MRRSLLVLVLACGCGRPRAEDTDLPVDTGEGGPWLPAVVLLEEHPDHLVTPAWLGDADSSVDVDGDGRSDTLAGSHASSAAGEYAGEVWLVLGEVRGEQEIDEVAVLHLVGEEEHAQLGTEVQLIGDLDGRGGPGLLAVEHGPSRAGVVYLVDATLRGTYSVVDVATASLHGPELTDFPHAVSAGDLDGDGPSDVAVLFKPSGPDEVHVFTGPLSGDHGLEDSAGSILSQSEPYGSLLGVEVVGDVDGDGVRDLATASPVDEVVSVFTMIPVGTVGSVDDADLLLRGAREVAHAGDADGDGVDDLLLRSWFDIAYLATDLEAGELDLAQSATAVISGELPETPWGGLAGVGDLTGDGLAELALGVGYEDTGAWDAGAVYMLLSPVQGTVDLRWAEVKVFGSQGDQVGPTLSSAVHSDGHSSLIVGTRGGWAGARLYFIDL